MVWICKYLYLGLMISVISVNSSPTRIRNYDVEEFCDKLLKSDKFEKLIERVADKAAEKITEINQHPHDNTDSVTQPNKVIKKSNSNNNEKHLKSNTDKKLNKITYSIAPLNDLSLQFKKFTKKAITKKSKNSKDLSNLTNESKESKETTNKSKESKETTTKSKDSKKWKKIDNTKESRERINQSAESGDISAMTEKDSQEIKQNKKIHNSDEKYNKKKNTEKGEYISDTKKNAGQDKKERLYDRSSNEGKSESNEGDERKRSNDDTVNDRKKESHKRNDSSKTSAKREYDSNYSKDNAVSKSIEMVKRSQYYNDTYKNENQANDEDENQKPYKAYSNGNQIRDNYDNHSRELYKENDDEHAMPMGKPIQDSTDVPIRRENGKSYVYQVSSEYEEYHDILRKVKQEERSINLKNLK